MLVEERFMQRALELARLGLGKVRPSALDACVAVRAGKMYAEAYVSHYGDPHPLAAVLERIPADQVDQCVFYLVVEPVPQPRHYASVLPLIKSAGVRQLVICHHFPVPEQAGQGLEALQGLELLEVAFGVLEEEGKVLNRRVITFHHEQRPFVLLKWAETADGYMARANGDSKWISNAYSRRFTHKWRTEEATIMVGPGTAIQDDPQLTARDWPGKNPVRVLLDRNLKVPTDLRLFSDVPTLVYNTKKSAEQGLVQYQKLAKKSFLKSVLHDMYKKGFQSVLVEGGPTILNGLLRAGLWDEARVFTSPVRFGEGVAAPKIKGIRSPNFHLSGDVLTHIYPLT